MSKKTADFLVIGGGIIGLNLALTAKRRHPSTHVTVIEKEKKFGAHASGRNSGVLHAGFYYTADSLKARFTRDGNRLLTKYCQQRKLKINSCGKLVVARNHEELSIMGELLRRAAANGVKLHELTEKEAKEIEPRVKTYQKALFSPTTSTINPREVMDSLVLDAQASGIELIPDTAYLSRDENRVHSSRGAFSAGYIINAAGLHADKIARDFNFSNDHEILPFKGLYLCGDEPPGSLKTHIYPVPDLNNPFLGIHMTVTSEGQAKIGPTAIPAFWREHYSGFENFDFAQLIEIVSRELGLFLRNDFNFRRLAASQILKYSKSKMVKTASTMLSGVSINSYKRWGAPGIRAQLFNTRLRKLEMDFHHEGDRRSFHVLNAVSPAFTCSMPFSGYIFDQIESICR